MHSPQRTHPADAGEYRSLPTDSTAPTATAGQGFPVGRRRPCRRKARPEPGLLWEAQFLPFGIEVSLTRRRSAMASGSRFGRASNAATRRLRSAKPARQR